jgi:hypothetical protein
VNPSQVITAMTVHEVEPRTAHRVTRDERDSASSPACSGRSRRTTSCSSYMTVGDLTTAIEVPGWADTIWLTQQGARRGRGDLRRDVLRLHRPLDRHRRRAPLRATTTACAASSAYSAKYSSNYGRRCASRHAVPRRAVRQLDDDVKKNDTIYRANLTYKIDDTKLMYGTWSEGFRRAG